MVEFAVGLLCGDVYLPFVAGVHLLQGDYPAGYQVAQPEGRSDSTAAAVEGFAVDGFPGVVGCDDAVASGRGGFGVAVAEHFVADAFVERFDALFPGFSGEPFAVFEYVVLLSHWWWLGIINREPRVCGLPGLFTGKWILTERGGAAR